MRGVIITNCILALLGFPLLTASEVPEEQTPPEVVGITLGSTTIHEAIHRFGPPRATYLAGDESGSTSPDSAMILSWETTLSMLGDRDVVLDLVVPPDKNTISMVHIYFDFMSGRPKVEDLVEFLGARGELVRRPTIGGGPEAVEIADCASPSGDVLTLVIPERGLDAYLEANGERVELLSFSLSRWRAGMPPPCSGEKLAN